ncbi:MAG: restriction endonuclease subunit S [Bacteroidaceae bacterium]|nr:restriction endonuclease subunit S [Bacteroidaceae bacterium]
MDYKKLGDYIRPVDVRNRDLKINLSQGICNAKYFQNPKQVADNPETHKVVRTGQFAYNRATTRNGEKISIALREGPDCTVSSAYQVFEIMDESQLNPKYLMMWFKRPEFDRLAIYYSHGSAHEFFEWDAMCDVKIPLPSIERQWEIVEEYETLSRRIRLNEQIIQHLESTAQALYRKMFVDNIDKENLPAGWRMGTLGEVATFKYGKLADKHPQSKEYPYPVFSGYAITGYTNEYTLEKPTIVIIARGDAGTGRICMSPSKCFLSNLAISIETKDKVLKEYLYYYLLESDTMSLRSGSAQAQITINNVEPFKIMIPSKDIYSNFANKVENLYKCIVLHKQENSKLTELQSLLLAKMGQK